MKTELIERLIEELQQFTPAKKYNQIVELEELESQLNYFLGKAVGLVAGMDGLTPEGGYAASGGLIELLNDLIACRRRYRELKRVCELVTNPNACYANAVSEVRDALAKVMD